jgi:hypothetical protein
VCGQGLDRPGDLPRAALTAAAEGALIGMAVDACHPNPATLYERPRTRPLSPGSAPPRPLVAVRIRF